MKKVVIFIINMHWQNVKRYGLLRTTVGWFILILALLFLIAGVLFITKNISGVESISILKIDFK